MWDLSSLEAAALITTVAANTESEKSVKIDVSPTPIEETQWIGDGSADSQIVAWLARDGGVRDWLPIPDGRPITGTKLIELAAAQDAMVDPSRFEDLAREVVTARA